MTRAPDLAAELPPDAEIQPRRTPTRVLAAEPPRDAPGPLGAADMAAAEELEEDDTTQADATLDGEPGLVVAGPGPTLPPEPSVDATSEDATEAPEAISEPPPLPEAPPSHLRLAEDAPEEAPMVTPLTDASADVSLVPVPSEVRRAASALAEAADSVSEARRPSRTRSRPPARDDSRAFGTLPSRADPPVPAPEAAYRALDDWTPPLRREESVIAEAAALRSGFGARVGRLFRGGLRAAGPAGLRAATALGESGMGLMRRFERLPRRAQIAWVVTPYLGALGLLLLLWTGGDEAPIPAEPEAPAIAAATAPEAAEAKSPAAPEAAEAKAPAAPEAAEVEAPEAAEAKAPATADPAAAPVAETRVLGRKSALYLRPTTRYRRAARLRKGHRLTVYPGIEAPKGWIVAVSEKDTVGYVLTRHLD